MPGRKHVKTQTPTQPHIVPLPKQVIASLREISPADSNPTGYVFSNSAGGELDNWDRWSKKLLRLPERRAGPDMICAGLAAPSPCDLGAPPHIVSVILGHRIQNTTNYLEIYNKSRYRREHAEALQRVADHIAALEIGASNVVPLRGNTA